jgi:hypothetical protein
MIFLVIDGVPYEYKEAKTVSGMYSSMVNVGF